MKKMITLAMILTVIITGSILLFTDRKDAKASSNDQRAIAFYSMRIERGDTLWSIAQKNITPEYSSIEEYISAIKKLNNMSSNTLYEGHYLIIPFYYDVIPAADQEMVPDAVVLK